jgi:hypothetical protein
MDPNIRVLQEFRIEHRHSDGSWQALQEVPHDSAAHDGERSWLRRAIFRCSTCDEQVTVTVDGDESGLVQPD